MGTRKDEREMRRGLIRIRLLKLGPNFLKWSIKSLDLTELLVFDYNLVTKLKFLHFISVLWEIQVPKRINRKTRIDVCPKWAGNGGRWVAKLIKNAQLKKTNQSFGNFVIETIEPTFPLDDGCSWRWSRILNTLIGNLGRWSHLLIYIRLKLCFLIRSCTYTLRIAGYH